MLLTFGSIPGVCERIAWSKSLARLRLDSYFLPHETRSNYSPLVLALRDDFRESLVDFVGIHPFSEPVDDRLTFVISFLGDDDDDDENSPQIQLGKQRDGVRVGEIGDSNQRQLRC